MAAAMREDSAEVAKAGLLLLKNVAHETRELRKPPETGAASPTQKVLPLSVVRVTRGYLEKITHQLNGSYDRGWYDACAVMMRKLIETLIIDVFEEQGMASKIQRPTGDFVQLDALVGRVAGQASWNLSRTTKQALSDVKKLGDNSAHGRRFAAHRGDIDGLRVGIRAAVQELIDLGGLGSGH